jgi:hypothetical protein
MKTTYNYFKFFLVLFLLFIITQSSFGTTYYWYYSGTGNWSSTSKWYRSTNSSSGFTSVSAYPNTVNDWVMLNGNTGVLTQDINVTVGNLEIASSKSLIINGGKTMNIGSGTSGVLGTISMQSSSTLTINSNGILNVGIGGNSYFNMYGTITNNGTINNYINYFKVYGTITNNGYLYNTGYYFQIPSGGTITNNGYYYNYKNTSNGSLYIDGTFKNNSVNFDNYNSSNCNIYINGVFENSADFTEKGNIVLQNSSIYRHMFTSTPGTVPALNWSLYSTCEFAGYTTNTESPAGLNQSIYNIKWNCANQTSNIPIDVSTFSVSNCFTMASSGTGALYLGKSSDINVNIGDSLIISGGTLYGNMDPGFATTINVNNDLIFSGGSFYLNNASSTKANSISVSDNFIKSGGTMNLNTSSSTETVMSLNHYITFSGGTLTADYRSIVRFCGVNSLSTSGSPVFSGHLDFIACGAQLSFENGTTSIINSDSRSDFTIDSAESVWIKHAQGLGRTGSATGCIQVGGTRNYSTGATYIFDSFGGIPGNGMPHRVRNMQITNSAFYLDTTYYISENLTISNCYLYFNGYNLEGTGSLLTSNNTELFITSPDGICLGTTSGNIRLSGTRSYASYSPPTLTYCGTSAQVTGNGVPDTITGLRIDNSSGVSLSKSIVCNSWMLLVNGNINIGANTITFRGDISRTSGTIIGGATSNIIIDRTGSNTTLGEVVNGVNNLSFLGPSTLHYTGAPIVVNGTFTLSSYLTIDNYTLTLNGTSQIINTGYLSGSSNGKLIVGGSGSIFRLPKFQLYKITINRPEGVTINGPSGVFDSLCLNGGNLFLNNDTLTFIGNTAVVAGNLSASRMIVTNGAGLIKKRIPDGSGAKTVYIPIGDTTGTPEFTPVTLNFTSGTYSASYIYVKVINAKHSSNSSATNYLKRYWFVSYPYASAFSCNVKFNYTQADVVGTESNIYCGKWNGSAWSLLNQANVDSNYISGTVTSFSEFTGGEINVMPVKLESFTAMCNKEKVNLFWKTSSEINNKGFEIQRQYSQNGTDYSDWIKAGYIAGKMNTQGISEYNFEDKCNNTGKYKYRLKQMDNNGNFEYYNLADIIDVLAPKEFSISKNYPNPFNPSTKFDINVAEECNLKLLVYDITGRLVKSLANEKKSSGYYTYTFNAGNLSSGIYFYRMVIDTKSKSLVFNNKMLFIK